MIIKQTIIKCSLKGNAIALTTLGHGKVPDTSQFYRKRPYLTSRNLNMPLRMN